MKKGTSGPQKIAVLAALALTLCAGGIWYAAGMPGQSATPAAAGTQDQVQNQTQDQAQDQDQSGAEGVQAAQAQPNRQIQEALEAAGSGQITQIALSAQGVEIDGSGASASGNTVTIVQGGVYRLSGQMEGQVRVEAGDQDQVILRLNGVELTNAGDAAIYVDNAKLTVVLLEEGTENRLQSGTEEDMKAQAEEDASGGALYARDDLALTGTGSLWVYGGLNNGIQTSNNLIVDSGSYQIQARNNGLKGKDSVTITGGSFAIECGNDGIQSDDTTGEGYGVVSIAGGSFSILSEGDGIQAETLLEISGGAFSVISGGGSALAASGQEDWGWDSWDDSWDNWDMESQDLPSTKGLKSGQRLVVSGGDLTVDALDDAFHTNGDMLVTGGTCLISTGDDGMHADLSLTVEGGSIPIAQSYEGLEANQVLLSGGDIQIVASDDGINANGGQSGGWGRGGRGQQAQTDQVEDMPNLTITGGSVTVDAQGDGLDSNGNLTVEGGTLVIDGPSGSGDGALDTGSEMGGVCRINGGTVLAVGPSRMAETFDESSGQCSFLYTFQQAVPAGTMIVISDSQGNQLFSHTTAKEADSLVFSSSDLVQGQTYQIDAGDQSVQITLDAVSTNAGETQGRFGGRGQGGRRSR